MEFVEVTLDNLDELSLNSMFVLPPDAVDLNLQETEEGMIITFLRCNKVEMHLGVGNC